MSPDAIRVRLHAALAVLIAVVGATCSTTSAHASDTSVDSEARVPATYEGARVRAGDDLILWRMCTGERSPRGEHFAVCTAMIGTIARTAAAHGISIGAQARAYSHVFPTSRRAGTSRLWILTMQPNGRRPAHWTHARWAPYRDDLLALLAHVRAVLAGRVFDKCGASAPVHFGNRRDGRRMGDFVRVCVWADDRQLLWAEASP